MRGPNFPVHLDEGERKTLQQIIRKRTEVDYFNETMVKPFKWTYQGKVLSA